MGGLKERLCAAADRGDVAAVRAALRAGADPNAPCPHLDGETALHLAARGRGAGHVATVRALLEAGADPLRRARGGTPLDEAARSGATEVLALLLATGADPDGGLRRGTTPLHRAARCGQVEAVRLLLDAGANPNALSTSDTPLHEAAAAGHEEVVRLLIERGPTRPCATTKVAAGRRRSPTRARWARAVPSSASSGGGR